MALYKFLNFIEHTQDANFDVFYPPEGTAPRSGIYRCRGCGREILSEELKPLPPKTHHRHVAAQGKIWWQLVVCAGGQTRDLDHGS